MDTSTLAFLQDPAAATTVAIDKADTHQVPGIFCYGLPSECFVSTARNVRAAAAVVGTDSGLGVLRAVHLSVQGLDARLRLDPTVGAVVYDPSHTGQEGRCGLL